MRQIGTLDDEDQAVRFEDYLLTQGIRARVDDEEDNWSIWIFEEDQVDRAREELERFRQSPDDGKYHATADRAERLRKEEEQRRRQYQRNQVNVRERWRRPIWAVAPVTTLMVAASIVATFASRFGEQPEPVVHWLGFTTFYEGEVPGGWYTAITDDGFGAVREGQVWRLVTPIFIHLDVLHLLFNMMWTLRLGGLVEYRRGILRYLAMVLLFAAGSNSAQCWWSGPHFGGMSGVGYGIFGYVWMKSRYEPKAVIWIDPATVFMFLFWLVICMTGGIGPVANVAHLVGLLLGTSVGVAPTLYRRLRRKL